ncbi:hypothetical protein PMAYCL1PPCAC_02184, partial [Pristionchus mayeri]
FLFSPHSFLLRCMGAVFSAGKKRKNKKKEEIKMKHVEHRSTDNSFSSFKETSEETSEFTTSPFSASVTEESEDGTHSSDTSFGVESLPEIKDYTKWRRNNATEDAQWLGAVKQFNDLWPVHRRKAEPAKLVRRLMVPKKGLSWAKAAKEVFKRQDVRWEMESEDDEEFDIHTISNLTDSFDASSVESSCTSSAS